MTLKPPFAAQVFGDFALARWRTPRPATFGVFCLLMVASMGLLSVGTPTTLYASTALGGFAYGGLNGGIPPIYSECWGLKAFGAIYATGSLAEGAASYLIATYVFGTLYEREVHRQGLDAGATCKGRTCFADAAFVAAGLSALAALLSFVLAKRSAPRYDLVYPKRAGPAARVDSFDIPGTPVRASSYLDLANADSRSDGAQHSADVSLN